MDHLQVTSRRDGDIGLLSVTGEMHLEIAGRFHEAGAGLLADGARHLLVDLHRVVFMDSASLATLIRFDDETRERNGRIVLFALSPAVDRVIVNAGLEGRFLIAEDEALARGLLE